MHKNMLMVNTKESSCEFMKITTSDYNRVIEVRQRTRALKWFFGVEKRPINS